MPKDTTSFGTAGNRSGNLLITNPTPSPLSHRTPIQRMGGLFLSVQSCVNKESQPRRLKEVTVPPGQTVHMRSDSVHVCVCVCVCAQCVHVCLSVYLYVCVCVCVKQSLDSNGFIVIPTLVLSFSENGKQNHVRFLPLVCFCLCACVRACVCVYVCVCMHACVCLLISVVTKGAIFQSPHLLTGISVMSSVPLTVFSDLSSP